MKLAWVAAGASDVGRVRSGNEDAFHMDAPRGLFLVADGMGGHAAGEIASALATETVVKALERCIDENAPSDAVAEAMVDAFHRAHAAIVRHTAENPDTEGMGTTLTALVACDDGTFRLGHIGDSRMYLLRGGELFQVTRDHTWVQREVEAGRLTPESARRHHLSHILTRALGADSADEPDVYSGTFLPGDVVLLATDGLTGMVPDRLIARVLSRRQTPAGMVGSLIEGANKRGGRDNITAVVVRFRDPDPTGELSSPAPPAELIPA